MACWWIASNVFNHDCRNTEFNLGLRHLVNSQLDVDIKRSPESRLCLWLQSNSDVSPRKASTSDAFHLNHSDDSISRSGQSLWHCQDRDQWRLSWKNWVALGPRGTHWLQKCSNGASYCNLIFHTDTLWTVWSRIYRWMQPLAVLLVDLVSTCQIGFSLRCHLYLSGLLEQICLGYLTD